MPVNGRHPYDVSKSCADLLAMAYAHSYGLPVAVARCGNVYGGGDLNWSRIVPGTIRSLVENRRPVLRSDGNMTRDYVYVKDVVEAYMLLADGVTRDDVSGEAFNFGCEQPVTVMEITRRIQRLMGRTDLEPLILNQVKGEIAAQYLHCGRARDAFGWSPRYGLDQGLMETIEWYRGFLGART
jgi:CDP-glucose 4,6-dehydratase